MNELEARIARTMARGRYLEDGAPSDAAMDRARAVAKAEPVLGDSPAPRYVDRGLKGVFASKRVARKAEPPSKITAQLRKILEETKQQLFKSGPGVRPAPKRAAASRTASPAGRRPATKSADFQTVLAEMVSQGYVPEPRPVQKSDPAFDRAVERLVSTLTQKRETSGEGRRVVIRR